MLLHQRPERVAVLPLMSKLGLRLGLHLRLPHVCGPLLPRRQRLQLRQPLVRVTVPQGVLHVLPPACDGDVAVLLVKLLDLLDMFLSLLPSVLLKLLLVLVHEVLEQFVPLVFLNELETLALAKILSGILVSGVRLQVGPFSQGFDEIVSRSLPLLALLLFLAFLRLGHVHGKLLLPLPSGVQREETTVLLAQLRGFLPFHAGLHAFVQQHVPEGGPALLRRLPLGLLLLFLLLLLVVAVLLLVHAS
mmetsp:Transcript_29343/g.88788  ORF Transcript_29343/g.88788 Transcript_29343/m.88788 type:complete len:247 (-) Transcript_29343:384-1124(-)